MRPVCWRRRACQIASRKSMPPLRPSLAAALFFPGSSSYSSSRCPVAISITRTACRSRRRRASRNFGPLGIGAEPHERSDETQQLGVLRAMPAAGEEIPDLDVNHLAARRLIGLVPDEHAPCGGV